MAAALCGPDLAGDPCRRVGSNDPLKRRMTARQADGGRLVPAVVASEAGTRTAWVVGSGATQILRVSALRPRVVGLDALLPRSFRSQARRECDRASSFRS